MSSIAHRGLLHLGMDVSKDASELTMLPPFSDVAEVGKLHHEQEMVRRLVKRAAWLTERPLRALLNEPASGWRGRGARRQR